jgi:uncharacterized protein YuzE
MRVSYDREADALYIRLIEGRHECRTLRLGEEVALNLGPGERLVGIEILDASRVIGDGHVPELIVENLPKSPKRAAGMLVVREDPAPYG